MKINSLSLKNFMIYHEIDAEFSPNINIICGENSTGKTALLKLLYTSVRGRTDAENAKRKLTKDTLEAALVAKFQGVFRPDHDAIGRLVNRSAGSSRTEVCLTFDKAKPLTFGFGTRAEKHLDVHMDLAESFAHTSAIYIPPKEIISSTENFVSLYADYHIAFEETYYDLARLLERPL